MLGSRWGGGYGRSASADCKGAEMQRAHQIVPRWDTNPIISPPHTASPRVSFSAKFISPQKSKTARQGHMRAGGMNVLANCFSPIDLTLEKIKDLLLRAIPETFPRELRGICPPSRFSLL